MTDASASSIAIAGVGPHVSRSRSSHEDIPIRAPRHVNAASITDGDDDRSQLEHMRSVHTQPVPQPLALEGPDDRRTRLLARLQLAKTQAWSDEGGGEARGAGLSIRGAASSSSSLSSSSSCHPRASGFGARGVNTPPLSTRLSSPPLRGGMGHRRHADAHKDAQSDPDTASGHIVDEAREKEAQLRLRARVRARLAAEKRAAAAG
ncbi:hypothetical protein BDN70DRAFT_108192 [Pholiota conissans]|uniref:Uncharacterized protein n=1 Tax=Pholiota conissans TaxID=109636 RepID=A0A9P5ZEV8_9AGAR|nr:hypothetical protein BDN70DRAFT_108192 [Pholiota conissans]